MKNAQSEMNVEWFEMPDLRQRTYNSKTWVPIRAYGIISREGIWGRDGYIEEFFGAGAVMVPIEIREDALKFEWNDVGLAYNTPSFEQGEYHEAAYFRDYRSGVEGHYLLLTQWFDTDENEVWHLSQDLVLGLGLLRQDDSWVRPEEGYTEVARLERDTTERPRLLKIRNEHLKDYLRASNCGLLLSRYHSRVRVSKTVENIDWPNAQKREILPDGMWEGRLQRAPTLEQLIRVSGELWKNDWVTPAAISSRVRGDHVESTIPFIGDVEGKTQSGEQLKEGIRWLWFRPSVINALLDTPKGGLTWYSEETGAVGGDQFVHFGVNEIGLITVFAKDIAELPVRLQRIWSAYNCTPEGGVSHELFMAQMQVQPATTVAPEVVFQNSIQHLQTASRDRFGQPLLTDHFIVESLLPRVNRFHATDMDGIYMLAKEINRIVIERIDLDLLKRLQPDLEKDLGSIKRLGRVLDGLGVDGYTLTGTLVGIYDLRMADAHLPSSDLSEALQLVGIGDETNPIRAAKKMITNVAQTIEDIASAFENSTNDAA